MAHSEDRLRRIVGKSEWRIRLQGEENHLINSYMDRPW